jgi:multiple stress resistance protein BhsA
MKTLSMIFAALALATASFSTLAATEVIQAPLNAQKIGVVSATSSNDLSSLERNLNAKAEEAGATSFRIVSASGNNHLYGTAELYR